MRAITHYNADVEPGFISTKLPPICGTATTKGGRAVSKSAEAAATRVRTTSDFKRVDCHRCFRSPTVQDLVFEAFVASKHTVNF